MKDYIYKEIKKNNENLKTIFIDFDNTIWNSALAKSEISHRCELLGVDPIVWKAEYEKHKTSIKIFKADSMIDALSIMYPSIKIENLRNAFLFPYTSAMPESNGEIKATSKNENESAYEYRAVFLN
jgi:hypothetical protein